LPRRDGSTRLGERRRLGCRLLLRRGGRGTLHDDAGEHDGTIENGASWTAGKFGSALRFDAEDDCVTVPDSEDLDLDAAFTLEAWVRPERPRVWVPVISKETSTEFISYQLYAGGEDGDPAGLVAENDSGYAEATGEEGLPEKVWSHLALTSDGEELILYVNGEPIDTAESVVAQESSGPLRIGCAEGWGHYEGLIDEVRVYDRVLEAGEIGADRETAIATPPSEDPIAAYSFDEGSGEVAEDAYGNHDGTIEGADWVGGKFGGALRFDAEAEDIVSVPDADDLQLSGSFTLEAWVRPSVSQYWMPVLTKETGGLCRMALLQPRRDAPLLRLHRA
jgi:hypothetical protein